jgi:hypothetical protein
MPRWSRSSMPAYPTAARIRPRLGSLAKKAVLTSGECAIAYATDRHSCRIAPAVHPDRDELGRAFPITHDGVRQLGCHHLHRHQQRLARPHCPATRSWVWAALLVAMTTNESLVDVSPSTVMLLNDASASSRRAAGINDGCTHASVAMNPSMVAMLGRIMPAPLLMPVTVTVAPPTSACTEQALGRVSVVMMPVPHPANCRHAHRQLPHQSGLDPLDRQWLHDDAGRERQHLLLCNVPAGWPAPRSCCAPAAGPAVPVPAFALPVLISKARISACPCARCSRHTCTGAAQKRFRVNTATDAAQHPSAHRQVFAIGLADACLGRRRYAMPATG